MFDFSEISFAKSMSLKNATNSNAFSKISKKMEFPANSNSAVISKFSINFEKTSIFPDFEPEQFVLTYKGKDVKSLKTEKKIKKRSIFQSVCREISLI